jgi:hypothetical protein
MVLARKRTNRTSRRSCFSATKSCSALLDGAAQVLFTNETVMTGLPTSTVQQSQCRTAENRHQTQTLS